MTNSVTNNEKTRVWRWLHTWSSLICTLFLLMLCVTGFALTFHDEIASWLNPDSWVPKHPNGPHLSLDQIATAALQEHKNHVPIYVSFDTDRPVVNVTSGSTSQVDATNMSFISIDATSGEIVPQAQVGEGVMEFLLQLHTDMFLGQTGMIVLAVMGILFVLAVVSGVVVYKDFMKKLPFGTLRLGRQRRLRWLDYHNFFGIIAVAWMTVVGTTGVINALESLILAQWRNAHLSSFMQSFQSDTVVQPHASLQQAVKSATSLLPNQILQFVAYPGSDYSTERHYAVFLHGNTPLTESLITPVLVDAITGDVAGISVMPWYMKGLALSRPLHFGDYGGIGLKLVWTALNLMSLIVLITGIYLYVKKKR